MAIAFVREATSSAKAVTSSTVAVAVTAGQQVILMVGSAVALSAVTDSQSNAWAFSPNAVPSGGQNVVNRGYTTASATGTLTVTVTAVASTVLDLDVLVFTGINLSDTTAYPYAATPSTGSATPSYANSINAGDLAIGGITVAGPIGDTFTGDPDTTLGAWSAATRAGTTGGSAGSNMTLNTQWKITTGTGTQTYDATLGNSRNWNDNIAGFAAAAITPVTPVTPVGQFLPFF